MKKIQRQILDKLLEQELYEETTYQNMSHHNYAYAKEILKLWLKFTTANRKRKQNVINEYTKYFNS